MINSDRQKKVLRLFNEQASDYNDKYVDVCDVRSFIFSERKKIVLKMLGGGFNQLLDIGCGPAVYTEELLTRCDELYGVDLSQEMVEVAKRKQYSRATFLVGSIEKLDFDDGFFDAVICVGVLEYLDDIERGIREIARVTKIGGIAIFTAPNASSLLNKLDLGMRTILKFCNKIIRMDISKSFMKYGFQPKLLDKTATESLLVKHNFKVENSVFHIFRISFLNRMWPWLSLFLARKLNFVSNRFVAINYIVKVRKR